MKKIKGQSLIEVIVTVFIISIALVAFMQVVYMSYVIETKARYKGYASYLVQDAAEIVTNIRDTGVAFVAVGDPSIPTWKSNLFTSNGFYYLDGFQPKTSWKLTKSSASVTIPSGGPCFSCSSPPILNTDYPEAILADDNSVNMTSAKPGYRGRDKAGTKGFNMYGTTFYRYVYIEEYDDPTTPATDPNPNLLHVRIIVSWQEKNGVMSVGEDLLLNNVGISGFTI